MNKKLIVFTKHALKRARERHLWKYVNKEKFYYDAQYIGINMCKLDRCIYVVRRFGEKTYIITMFSQ